MNTIGKRIRYIRGNTSQSDFAAKAGINKSTLGRYERGVNSPDVKAIEAICRAFLIRSEWLISGKGLPEEIPDGSKLIGLTNEDVHAKLVDVINGQEYNRDILKPIQGALREALSEQRIQIGERHFQALSLVLYEEFLERVVQLANR